MEIVLDLLAAVLCVIALVFLGPLYVRANGAFPLIVGNFAILGLVTIGVAIGLVQEEPLRYAIIRIFVLFALIVPAWILLHRKH